MITLTDSAQSEIRTMLDQPDNSGANLRIGVMGGGCSGLEYYMGFDSDVNDDDEIYEQTGFKLVIDRESMPHLDGSTLDFARDLMNSGFVFNNPNASRTCGCGKSFCG